jgi:hypothetical protein
MAILIQNFIMFFHLISGHDLATDFAINPEINPLLWCQERMDRFVMLSQFLRLHCNPTD